MSLTYTSSFKSILNIACKKYRGGLTEPLVIEDLDPTFDTNPFQ